MTNPDTPAGAEPVMPNGASAAGAREIGGWVANAPARRRE